MSESTTGARSPLAPRLLAWFDRHGRHDLPWKVPHDPYRIWVSEIMLQQTQVTTVLPYFERFMASFPNVEALAAADTDTVMAHWTGLGYYARARNLHKAARAIVHDHDGKLPETVEALQQLPGIGPSTAGAIAAMAFDCRAPILDGNVRRVLTRYHGILEWPGERTTEQQLWALADAHTPADRPADYTQAIMDLGATLCVRSKPRCDQCPLAADCIAYQQGLTNRIPAPRPRRERPTRERLALLLRAPDGQILLEQRPPSGIWGGLWSFPELEADQDPIAEAARRLALPAETLARRPSPPPSVHQFSHYRLELHWIPLQLSRIPPAGVNERPLAWFASHATADVALAAPAKQLLQQPLPGLDSLFD